MAEDRQILQLLSDGNFHSGQELASQLGMSRSALWKRLQKLQQELAIELYAVSGKGYKLSNSLQLLTPDKLERGLRQSDRLNNLPLIETHLSLGSTNQRALEQAMLSPHQPRLILAERQTAGRGRRGRHWVSPFGRNLYLSLYWWYENMPESIASLSLMVAIILAKHLEAAGVPACELKWPNDVRFQGQKLAGILLEMQGEAAGGCGVVVGIGVNLDLRDNEVEAIDQPWTDVRRILGKNVDRERFAIDLLVELVETLREFPGIPFTTCLDEWHRRDVLLGREVNLTLANQTIHGISRGIDEQGALLLEDDGRVRRFYSGEVSVRLAEDCQ
jgi:BirA family biotin operon repressor/biotin-[acetyl-CoA-carboxylase] ligase